MASELHLTLHIEEVCERARLSREQLLCVVAENIIQPCSGNAPDWRFDASAAALAARAARLHRDLDLDWHGVALALELLQELDLLRRENHQLRQRLRRFEQE